MDRLRILIVEDDADNVASARRTLSDHDLTIVETAGEALDLIHRAHRDDNFFDVVMTDLNLPHGDRGDGVFESFRDSFDTRTPNPIMGMAVAINALSLSSKPIFVAIVSDGNHHRELGAALLDYLHPFSLQERFGPLPGRIVMIEARNIVGVAGHRPDRTPIKEWGVALNLLLTGNHT